MGEMRTEVSRGSKALIQQCRYSRLHEVEVREIQQHKDITIMSIIMMMISYARIRGNVSCGGCVLMILLEC